MLQKVTAQELQTLLLQEGICMDADAAAIRAEALKRSLDSRLEDSLTIYLRTGQVLEYSYGAFSLCHILALKRNRKFFQAVLLLDGYMKDPINGKARILRR